MVDKVIGSNDRGNEVRSKSVQLSSYGIASLAEAKQNDEGQRG